MSEKSVFATLNAVNVSGKAEKKNGMTYLSWAYAWGEVKSNYPDAFYTIYENAEGWNYFTDGKTCWVKTGVTIEGMEHIEYLPVMDFKNKSIPLNSVTSFDVNKAIQRSLTKACARHGLGLYIYAGEDLPAEEKEAQHKTKTRKADPPKAAAQKPQSQPQYKDTDVIEDANFKGTFKELKENVQALYVCANTGVPVADWVKQMKLEGASPERWLGARNWVITTYSMEENK